MFKVEEFKKFIVAKVNNKDVKHYNLLIDGLCQFKLEVAEYSKLSINNISKKLRKIFSNLCEEKNKKSIRLSFRTYLLYLHGFKKCSSCTEILNLKLFNIDSYTWSGLRDNCKKCHTQKTREYQNRSEIKETLKVYYSKRRKAYPEYFSALNAKCRALLSKASPKWVSKIELVQIEKLYYEAKQRTIKTGIKYHVDHIIPLNGVNVCGLHTISNLQILSEKENLQKSNKMAA